MQQFRTAKHRQKPQITSYHKTIHTNTHEAFTVMCPVGAAFARWPKNPATHRMNEEEHWVSVSVSVSGSVYGSVYG